MAKMSYFICQLEDDGWPGSYPLVEIDTQAVAEQLLALLNIEYSMERSFELVASDGMEIAERVLHRQRCQTLRQIVDIGDLDPDTLRMAGLPSNAETNDQSHVVAKLLRWEPDVREELGIGSAREPSANGPAEIESLPQARLHRPGTPIDPSRLPAALQALVRRFDQQGLSRIVTLHFVQGRGEDPFFDGDPRENLPPRCDAGLTVPYAGDVTAPPGGHLHRQFYLTGTEEDRHFFIDLVQQTARLFGRNAEAGFLSMIVDAAWETQRDCFALWVPGNALIRQGHTHREIRQVEGRLLAEWTNAFYFCADMLPTLWKPKATSAGQALFQNMSPEEREELRERLLAQADHWRDKLTGGTEALRAIHEQWENSARDMAETIERIGREQDLPAPVPAVDEPVKAAPEGEWVGPMTKGAMAVRLTGNDDARWRQVAGMFDADQIQQVTSRRFRFRIDHLDKPTREKCRG